MLKKALNLSKIIKGYYKRKKSTGTVVIGSSSSEIFDYLFGDNPKYHPFWISGWSARGLQNGRTQNYIGKILHKIDRNALVILCFGAADIFFNLSYKKAKGETLCPEKFACECADGIEKTVEQLKHKGFHNIINILYNPVPYFNSSYWDSIGIKNQLETVEMEAFLKQIACKYANRVQTLNLLSLFSERPDLFITSSRYKREADDHHLDYIKIQKIFWREIRHLRGILPRRKTFHKKLYEHIGSEVEPLISTNQIRPRTCR